MIANDHSEEVITTKLVRTGDIPTYGKFRHFSDLTLVEVAFLCGAVTSILIAAITSIIRLEFRERDSCCDFSFIVLLLVNLGFLSIYVVHGIFFERPFEIIVAVCGTIIVILYCFIEYVVHGHSQDSDRKQLKIARLITVCVFGLLNVVLGSIISFRFLQSKSLIFRSVGGNTALQKMCQKMFAFTAFLKFDFQIVVSLLILILFDDYVGVVEKVMLGICVPLSLAFVVIGFVMLHYELLKLSCCFWILSATEPALVFYEFYQTGKFLHGPASKHIIGACILAVGVLALFVRVIVLWLSVLVTRNFNKGLKEKLFLNSTKTNEENIDCPIRINSALPENQQSGNSKNTYGSFVQ